MIVPSQARYGLIGRSLVTIWLIGLSFCSFRAVGADVTFSINSTQGVHSISPYIYGMNQFNGSMPPVNLGLQRLGGNRWTGYNWETNYSNAGTDYMNHSDLYLTSGQVLPPGGAVAPSLSQAAANGYALSVTIPMAGYVAADGNGTVSVGETAPSARWKQVVAKKSSIAGQPPLTLAPNPNDQYVFTDELANWVEHTKQPGQQVFYTLDNEPGLWDDTHPRIHPTKPMFQELVNDTIAHSSAIKDVAPGAVIFGPGGFGWSDFQDLNGAPDSNSSTPPAPGTGKLHFHQWLLQQVAAEEAQQHRTLLDVLDMHWYPEAQGGGVRITAGGALNNSAAVVAARVQAPRSLYDPTYTETSWITGCCSGGPIQLLNRVQSDVNQFKPGTKMSISEYNYGGGNDISGAIAEADVLGAFGKKDVYAAAWWNIEGDGNTNFTFAALDMFRNYDGAGAHFGDTSIDATTSNIVNSSVYASVDANNPNRMTVVAINRTNQPLSAAIAIADDNRFTQAQVYQLTSALASPVHGGSLNVGVGNQFNYLMPAMSVTTLVLTTLPGDYNADGKVDAGDYLAWRKKLGSGSSLPNGDDTAGVGQDDYLRWRAQFGQSAPGAGTEIAASSSVPEPKAAVMLLIASLGLQMAPRLPRPATRR